LSAWIEVVARNLRDDTGPRPALGERAVTRRAVRRRHAGTRTARIGWERLTQAIRVVAEVKGAIIAVVADLPGTRAHASGTRRDEARWLHRTVRTREARRTAAGWVYCVHAADPFDALRRAVDSARVGIFAERRIVLALSEELVTATYRAGAGVDAVEIRLAELRFALARRHVRAVPITAANVVGADVVVVANDGSVLLRARPASGIEDVATLLRSQVARIGRAGRAVVALGVARTASAIRDRGVYAAAARRAGVRRARVEVVAVQQQHQTVAVDALSLLARRADVAPNDDPFRRSTFARLTLRIRRILAGTRRCVAVAQLARVTIIAEDRVKGTLAFRAGSDEARLAGVALGVGGARRLAAPNEGILAAHCRVAVEVGDGTRVTIIAVRRTELAETIEAAIDRARALIVALRVRNAGSTVAGGVERVTAEPGRGIASIDGARIRVVALGVSRAATSVAVCLRRKATAQRRRARIGRAEGVVVAHDRRVETNAPLTAEINGADVGVVTRSGRRATRPPGLEHVLAGPICRVAGVERGDQAVGAVLRLNHA